MSDPCTCPKCEHEIDTDDWCEHWHWDGDSFEAMCPECENVFDVKVSIDVSYEVIEDR